MPRHRLVCWVHTKLIYPLPEEVFLRIAMKSFSLEQSTHFIDTVKVLNTMDQQNVHQLNRPQKISKNLLKEFEKREKRVKIITDDGMSYMTHLISVDSRELVIRLLDNLKIRFKSHLLLVFPSEGKDYVVQGFVKKVFLPIVVLSYVDPRYGKRWTLNTETQVHLSPVSDPVLTLFMNEDLRLIRRSDVIRPASLSGRDGEAEEKEKVDVALAIEDVLCTDVVFDEAPEDAQNVVVYEYEEADCSYSILSQSVTLGRIHDISPSGLAMIAKKGDTLGQVGGLVSLEFHDLLSKDQKSGVDVFKLRLFGIVRYQRPFDEEDEQIFGIKFVKTINDTRFLNFLEETAEALI